jgi:hypothetical protein
MLFVCSFPILPFIHFLPYFHSGVFDGGSALNLVTGKKTEKSGGKKGTLGILLI